MSAAAVVDDLTAEQLAEIASFEFGRAEVFAAPRFAGETSACETSVVPNQQLVVRADGFAANAATQLEVTDSFTNQTRITTLEQDADSAWVVTYSFLVPNDDLVETIDQDVAMTVEVIGDGSVRGVLVKSRLTAVQHRYRTGLNSLSWPSSTNHRSPTL